MSVFHLIIYIELAILSFRSVICVTDHKSV